MKLGLSGFVLSLLLLPSQVQAECIGFAEALNHVGEIRCVSGKVFAVKQGLGGVHYLDFCQNYQTCPFTVVIFPADLRHVGDVRQLAGRLLEVHGPVKLYDGRAEIILSDARQLSGEAAQLPQLPKNYDVERKGRFSAGKYSRAGSTKQTSRKRQSKPIQTEDTSADSEE